MQETEKKNNEQNFIDNKKLMCILKNSNVYIILLHV